MTYNTEKFEKHIQETINKDLYVENTDFEDRKRIMLSYNEKKPIYICAIPSGEIYEEPNNMYQDMHGGRLPSYPEIESKVKHFLNNLEENLELYD